MARSLQIGAALLVSMVLWTSQGCGTEGEMGAFLDHEEDSDFLPVEGVDGKSDGITATFNANLIMEDALFLASDAVTAEGVQAFLESTPYDGLRCFLADELVNGKPASQVIVEEAAAQGLNPLLLLGRMQVEKGLISKSVRPSQSTVDYALGCGCHDGTNCNTAYRGLDKQLACGAETLRGRYEDSVAGTGEWRVGLTKTTRDGVRVTPSTHGTASLYAYTPWVLVNRGGNWLVWNVSRKYILHFKDQGHWNFVAPGWVGTYCTRTDDPACAFSHELEQGFCHTFTSAATGLDYGFCTLRCEGYCPDRDEVTTFCIELVPGEGRCAAKATTDNNQCQTLPGTVARQEDRFVGSSGASEATALVCVPE